MARSVRRLAATMTGSLRSETHGGWTYPTGWPPRAAHAAWDRSRP